MNNKKRKRISDILVELESASLAIEEIRAEEEEGYDNMPESFQQTERGRKMEEAISELEDAYDSISDAVSSLETLIE